MTRLLVFRRQGRSYKAALNGLLIILITIGCGEAWDSERPRLIDSVSGEFAEFLQIDSVIGRLGSQPLKIDHWIDSVSAADTIKQSFIKNTSRLYFLAKLEHLSGDNDRAISHLNTLLRLDLSETPIETSAYNLLGMLYYYGGQFEPGFQKFEYNYKLFQKSADTLGMVRTLQLMSTMKHLMLDFDSALYFQRRAVNLAKSAFGRSIGEKQLRNIKAELAPTFIELAEYDSAEYYLGLSVSDSMSATDKMSYAINMGMLHEKRGSIDSALKHYLEAEDLAELTGDKYDLYLAWNNQSAALQVLGQCDSAFMLQVKASRLYDEIQTSDYGERLKMLEIKYADAKKDAKLKDLEFQAEIDKNFRSWMIAFSILALITMISIFMFYRNKLRAEKKVRGEQEKRFVKEKELVSMHASMEALERERKRVAMDLHDGIGVLASTAKLRVSQVNKRLESEALKSILNETNEVLSEITKDVKRIAHNIMPSSLSKLGLKAAVEELAEKAEKASSINFELDLDEFTFEKESGEDIMLYRIIQELVNNGIKHSQGTQIKLDLKHQSGEIRLAYADNGIGFDLDNTYVGNGINTMRSRIEHLKGHVSIKTEMNKGVRFEFKLPHGS